MTCEPVCRIVWHWLCQCGSTYRAAAFWVRGPISLACFTLTQPFDLDAHGRSCPVQAAANRADGDIQNACDGIVVKVLDFSQHQHASVLIAQLPQSLLDLECLFLVQESICRRGALVDRLVSERLQGFVRGNAGPSPPMPIGYAMHGNSVQPRVKGAFTPERIQLEIRLDEGILDNVFGFFQVSDDVGDTGEQSILMRLHEPAEGVRVALFSLFNQWSFIIHGNSKRTIFRAETWLGKVGISEW